MTGTRHAGTFRLSGLLLKSALGLPEDTTLLAASLDTVADEVELTVAHPDLPAVAEGAWPILVQPLFTDDTSRYRAKLLRWRY